MVYFKSDNQFKYSLKNDYRYLILKKKKETLAILLLPLNDTEIQ